MAAEGSIAASSPTYTPAEVALRYGKTSDYVLRRARAEKDPWPHLRVGRSIRFTDEHIKAIDAMHEVKGKSAPPVEESDWGQKTRRAS